MFLQCQPVGRFAHTLPHPSVLLKSLLPAGSSASVEPGEEQQGTPATTVRAGTVLLLTTELSGGSCAQRDEAQYLSLRACGNACLRPPVGGVSLHVLHKSNHSHCSGLKFVEAWPAALQVTEEPQHGRLECALPTAGRGSASGGTLQDPRLSSALEEGKPSPQHNAALQKAFVAAAPPVRSLPAALPPSPAPAAPPSLPSPALPAASLVCPGAPRRTGNLLPPPELPPGVLAALRPINSRNNGRLDLGGGGGGGGVATDMSAPGAAARPGLRPALQEALDWLGSLPPVRRAGGGQG